jgi:hypothetical protein
MDANMIEEQVVAVQVAWRHRPLSVRDVRDHLLQKRWARKLYKRTATAAAPPYCTVQ